MPSRPPPPVVLTQPRPARSVALIVDDSPVNRKLLARHLDTLEIDSREAADGAAALELLRSSGSDVAVASGDEFEVESIEVGPPPAAEAWRDRPEGDLGEEAECIAQG